MKILTSETAGRREFLDYIKDQYNGKLLRLVEMRNLYNALLTNFTASSKPGSEAYKNSLKPIYPIALEAANKVPEPIFIIYDFIDEERIKDIDYLVMHHPKDAEAILRIDKPEGDLGKVILRNLDLWKLANSKAKDRIILLDYEDRLRDVVTVDENFEGGVTLSISPATAAKKTVKPDDSNQDSITISRLMGM